MLEYFAKGFNRVAYQWYHSHGGNRYTKAGTANEACIAHWLFQDPAVVSLFDVGLVERKGRPWLACSSDGVLIMRTAELQRHLEVDEARYSNRTKLVLPCEMKTFCTDLTITPHLPLATEAKANNGWLKCNAGNKTEFARVIPSASHRCQVLHQATVFNAKAVVYVAATVDGILYKVLVEVPQGAIADHVDMLEPIAQALFGWMYCEKPEVPSYVPLVAAGAMRSHHELWWAVRKHVLAHGPLPPVKHLRQLLVWLYNNTMGAVDGVDRGNTRIRPARVMGSKCWEEAFLLAVLHEGPMNNLVRLFRLAECKQFLTENGWCGLPQFKRRLRKVTNNLEALKRAALEVLDRGGARPGQAQPAMPTGDDDPARSSPRKRRAFTAFASELQRMSERKRRRTLESDDGRSFRKFSRDGLTHKAEHLGQKERGWCAFCAVTKPGVGKTGTNTYEDVRKARRTTGSKSQWRCAMCNVRLCMNQRDGQPCCFDQYHEGAPTAYQRYRASLAAAVEEEAV